MKTIGALSIAEGLILPKHCWWQVRSIHDDYVNLVAPEGFVTLIKSGSSLIPFGIEVGIKDSWHNYRLSEGQPVFQGPDSIVLGDVLTITGIHRRTCYICRPQTVNNHNEIELVQRIERISQLCVTEGKTGGILTYLGKYDPQLYWLRESFANGLYEDRIRRSFEVLVSGVYRDDDFQIIEGICNLLGIGPGLTPSGDDFLLGFLCGLRIIGQNSCRRVADKIAQFIEQNAPCLTTLMSAEYLKYGARGMYHQRVNEFIDAFNIGSENDLISKAIDLMNLGHFSGVDLLTGFAYGGLTAVQVTNGKI